ncbi:MAG: hypothetical protein MZV63_56565 [Marinilabiliales bacterium]|nr:hypothetical protein [Marinilabiliales bacterium]
MTWEEDLEGGLQLAALEAVPLWTENNWLDRFGVRGLPERRLRGAAGRPRWRTTDRAARYGDAVRGATGRDPQGAGRRRDARRALAPRRGRRWGTTYARGRSTSLVTDRFHNSDPGNDRGRDPASYDGTRTDWGEVLGRRPGRGDRQARLPARARRRRRSGSTPVFDQVDGTTDAEGRGRGGLPRLLDPGLPAAGRAPGGGSRPTSRVVPAQRHGLRPRWWPELHRRGMRLVLDVVCNHSSPVIGLGTRASCTTTATLLTSYDDDRLGWYHRAGRDHRLAQRARRCRPASCAAWPTSTSTRTATGATSSR